IPPRTAIDRTKKPKRNSNPQRETKRDQAKRERNRQTLRNNFRNRMIAILERRPKVTMQSIDEKAPVLFQDRFVEVILRFKIPFNFRRSRASIRIKRPTRHKPHQRKRDQADDQQQRDER